jgi:hypothetical protein
MSYQLIKTAINYFSQGYTVGGVAKRLGIPVKQARQLQNIYWQQEMIATAIEKQGHPEITEYYAEELQKRRRESVERFLKRMRSKVSEEFSGPNDPRVWQRVARVLDYFPSAQQILVFPPGGKRVVSWVPA